MKTFCLPTIVAFLLLCLTSCVKQNDLVAPPQLANSNTPATAASFSEIKTSDNFAWSTTKQVAFQFAGYAQAEYQTVLKVTLADGSVVFQKLQKANEDFQDQLHVPAHVTSLTVSFGSTTKTFEINSGSVTLTIN